MIWERFDIVAKPVSWRRLVNVVVSPVLVVETSAVGARLIGHIGSIGLRRHGENLKSKECLD